MCLNSSSSTTPNQHGHAGRLRSGGIGPSFPGISLPIGFVVIAKTARLAAIPQYGLTTGQIGTHLGQLGKRRRHGAREECIGDV
jgi:hypothetical protein